MKSKLLGALVALVALGIGTAPANAVLALNGTPATGIISGAASSTIVSGTFTTTVANTVIIACVDTTDAGPGGGPYTVSSLSGGNLTWTKRSSQSGVDSVFHAIDLECWYAVAASTFSSAVTATLSGAAGAGTISVFAFSGANTTTPFDSNVSLPAKTTNFTATVAAVSATISTTSANTAIFGHVFQSTGSQTTWTDNTGFTTTANVSGFSGSPNFAPGYSQGQYKIVSSAQSSAAVAFTPNTDNFIYIVDGIQAASAGGNVQNETLMMTGFGG